MLRLARAMVGETDAAEVVQDTWAAMIGSLSGFEGRSRLHTAGPTTGNSRTAGS
ncbi:MAG: hypothetical protein HYR49_01910 [Gammaproteobacteria bacterium]|nr:hypothetical protein [Gammaproteobacteria bacterium]